MKTPEKVVDELSDQELLQRFRTGEEEVFDLLIERYSTRMYQTAYAILGCHHDAQEVVQDALVKAYRALDRFRGESSLLTWLCRIVINQSRNKYHWNRRRGSEVNLSLSRPPEAGSDQEQEDFAIPDEHGMPDRVLANAELGELLNREIRALPGSLRETMALRHLQNLAYEEIAAIQHCRLGTIKSRLSRGRDLLLARLKRYGLH